MSYYYGDATLEDWLAEEVFYDWDHVPSIVVELFEKWRKPIESNIVSWMESDLGGEPFSWRFWGRGFDAIPDEDKTEFDLAIERAEALIS